MLYCPLPPCYIKGVSQPPANGADGYRRVADYAEHLKARHFLDAKTLFKGYSHELWPYGKEEDD